MAKQRSGPSSPSHQTQPHHFGSAFSITAAPQRSSLGLANRAEQWSALPQNFVLSGIEVQLLKRLNSSQV